MKKLLPHFSFQLIAKSLKPKTGFTLVELMVVVSILAILAVTAFSAFNGAQGSARDGRKLAEINALAKNIESTKDPTSTKYQYTSALFLQDYPNGLVDPKYATGYCLQISSSAITKPANWSPTAAAPCPGSYTEIKSGFTAPTADLYFMLCAASERSTNAICQAQFTK